MHTPLTAVFHQRGDWFIGYVEELAGANFQECTFPEAMHLNELNGDAAIREVLNIQVSNDGT